MKKKKLYLPLLAIAIIITIVLLTNVQSLLANYNIVDDIQLSTSSNTLSEGETVTLTLTDTNIEDTKVVIPIDESMEFIESDYLDGAVVYDSLNKQLVVDWLDATKEQKNVSITLRTTKQGTYEVKALTVREEQEVSTNITELEVENVDESKVEDSSELPTDEIVSEDSSLMEEAESSSELDAVPENEDVGKEEEIAEETKEGRAELTGVWGTAPWSFDATTGVLEIDSGTLSEVFTTKPWETNKEFFINYPIKVIRFNGTVILPKNSEALFFGKFSDRQVYWADNLERFDGLNYLDTSKVTTMNSMFANLSSLTSLDISNFDTSQVTNMYRMFNYLSSLTSLDISNFDTSQVTTMNSMFANLSSLTSLDLSSFDTSQVTDMSSMFYSVESLTSLDVSNFDTSKVTDMSSMFSYLPSLTSLDLSNFDTSQVTDMSSMVNAMALLVSLDVSSFDTSKVMSMNSMFSSLSSLTSLDVSNFDTSKVTNMKNMFSNLSSLTSLDVSNFDTSQVTNMNNMFGNLSALTSLDLSSFDISKVTDMFHMFKNISLQKLTLGDKIKIEATNLGSPRALKNDDKTTGKWILEGSYNKGYTPEEFMENYGKIPELQAGTYVAEVVKPASITGESKLTGEATTDSPLTSEVYVNEKVKFGNNIHHEGSVFNYTYKTTIPEAVTLDLDSFTGYMINENGEKIELPKEAFAFDENSRILKVNPKGVSKTDPKGNYYSEGPTDFYYEGYLTIGTEEKLLMTNLSLNTSIAYENNILESQKSIDLNTIESKITGRSPEFSEPKIEVKNLNRSTGEVAVGDEFEVTISGKNIQEYAVYDGEFAITALNNRNDDYSEVYFENTTYVDNSIEYLSPEGVFKIDDDDPGVNLDDVHSALGYTRSKLPEYENIKYLGMEIFGIRYKVKVTEMALGKQISFRGRFGNTQLLTTNNITLDVNYSGKLGFKEAPKTLSFNDSLISVFTSTIERSDENWGIEIEDSRQQKQPWWLTVKQVSPFKSVDDDLLPQVLIFRQAGQDDQWLSADTAISVHYEDGLSVDDYTTSWSKNEGFFLKVPPGTAKAKQYQTELQWYIQDTPI